MMHSSMSSRPCRDRRHGGDLQGALAPAAESDREALTLQEDGPHCHQRQVRRGKQRALVLEVMRAIDFRSIAAAR